MTMTSLPKHLKKLKIWNGRGDGRGGHLYICATSQRQAVALVNQSGFGYGMSLSELRDYYAEGCWGVAMNDITPEIGVWTVNERTRKRKRLI
jgi:hypothetical protein